MELLLLAYNILGSISTINLGYSYGCNRVQFYKIPLKVELDPIAHIGKTNPHNHQADLTIQNPISAPLEAMIPYYIPFSKR